DVDAFDLDFGRLLVQQRVQLTFGELGDRLVRVEEAAAAEDPAVPAVHAVTRDGQRSLAQRLGVVVEGSEVEVGDTPPPLTAQTHAAGDVEVPALLDLATTAFDVDRSSATDGGDVERECLGRTDMGLTQAAEQDPQHGSGVGCGPDG